MEEFLSHRLAFGFGVLLTDERSHKPRDVQRIALEGELHLLFMALLIIARTSYSGMAHAPSWLGLEDESNTGVSVTFATSSSMSVHKHVYSCVSPHPHRVQEGLSFDP